MRINGMVVEPAGWEVLDLGSEHFHSLSGFHGHLVGSPGNAANPDVSFSGSHRGFPWVTPVTRDIGGVCVQLPARRTVTVVGLVVSSWKAVIHGVPENSVHLQGSWVEMTRPRELQREALFRGSGNAPEVEILTPLIHKSSSGRHHFNLKPHQNWFSQTNSEWRW